MKPLIPLATVADPTQVERVRALLEGRACVIVGSAPLRTPLADVSSTECAIAVNGGISSLPRPADVWVVGSKQQDKPGDPNLRPLHQTMLEQARGRSVNHLLLLRGPKIASECYTLAALERLHFTAATWSVLDKPTKRWLEGELCARTDDKQPCSSGVLAAAVALWCGAASVRLVGFSFMPGYHYLPNERGASWWRNHVAADKRALAVLMARYPGGLSGALVQEVAA